MKIINNRFVCSGCEEPFEIKQKVIVVAKKLWEVEKLTPIGKVSGYPVTFVKEDEDRIDYFHESCD